MRLSLFVAAFRESQSASKVRPQLWARISLAQTVLSASCFPGFECRGELGGCAASRGFRRLENFPRARHCGCATTVGPRRVTQLRWTGAGFFWRRHSRSKCLLDNSIGLTSGDKSSAFGGHPRPPHPIPLREPQGRACLSPARRSPCIRSPARSGQSRPNQFGTDHAPVAAKGTPSPWTPARLPLLGWLIITRISDKELRAEGIPQQSPIFRSRQSRRLSGESRRGFRNKAQRLRGTSYSGSIAPRRANPDGVASEIGEQGHNPMGLRRI